MPTAQPHKALDVRWLLQDIRAPLQMPTLRCLSLRDEFHTQV